MSYLRAIGNIGLRVPWKLRAVACLVYVIILTWLLLAPATTVDRFYPNFRHVDKVLHFLMFGGLVLITRFAFRDPRCLAVPGWLVPGLALVYGAAIELTQGHFVQYHRAFEWGDIAANGLGAASCWFLSVCLLANAPRQSKEAG